MDSNEEVSASSGGDEIKAPLVVEEDTTNEKSSNSDQPHVNDEETIEAVDSKCNINQEVQKNDVPAAFSDSTIEKEGANVDVEMEAMFSEEPTSVVEDQNRVQPDASKSEESRDIKLELDQSHKDELNQMPDESNLEFMMEALHADKVSESPPQKQSETSGLELKDVLQALTGDLEPDDNHKKSSSVEGKIGGDGDDQREQEDESNKKDSNSESVSTRITRQGKKQQPQASESESDDDSGSQSIASRLRKPIPDTKINKVCALAYCRQQCSPERGISLHRFPTASNPMRTYWLKLTKINPSGPGGVIFICSKHFHDDDYNYDNTKDPSDAFYKKLKPKSVPTVDLPVSDDLIELIKRKVNDVDERQTRSSVEASKKATSSEDKKTLKKGGTSGKKVKFEEESDETEEQSDQDDSDPEKGKPSILVRRHSDSKEGENSDKKGNKPKRALPMTATPIPNSPSRSSTSSYQAISRTPFQKKKGEVESKIRTPGTNCSIPSCSNNLFETRAEGINVSYYRFPFDNDLAEKWMKKIGDTSLNTRTARICSDHFNDKDFTDISSGGKRTLKPKAVPSLYLNEKKPKAKGGSDRDDEEDEDGESSMKRKRKSESKRKSKIGKPDTSSIAMPLPIIEDVDIKIEPISDNEDIGQEYVAEEPDSADEEYIPLKKLKIDKGLSKGNRRFEAKSDEENAPPAGKRPRGRPRKDRSMSGISNRAGSSGRTISQIKTVSIASLSMPVVSVERLGKRVVEAADAGTLRVRIKESQPSKSNLPASSYRPGPKSKRKRLTGDDDIEAAHEDIEDEENSLQYKCKPGPLSKKKKILEQLRGKDGGTKKKVSTTSSGRRPRKVLKMSDFDTDSDIDDPPSSSFHKDSRKSDKALKVKLAELPEFLQEKAIKSNLLESELDSGGDFTCDLESLLASEKSDKDKIIQLVEQRISEHTKIIEGKTMGPQQLADHNKILQGSALVLKRLAEKSGKTLPASQIISETGSLTSGRTIVLKKVADPGKLGLKPPHSARLTSAKSESSSPSRSPAPSNKSPLASTKMSNLDNIEFREELSASTALEKIREYDTLMKRYLSAVLDKNVMSKKYTEAKEAQKSAESKLQEKAKELDVAKRKINSLQAKANRINAALESFLTPNQIKLALQETKKVAWSPEEMLTAFTIKHLSKACYLFLRHKLNYPLPGISSLQRWMTMLSKDKVEDDEDNIADEDVTDKEDNQEMLEDGLGVVNEITGTLEEINACGAPGLEHSEGVDHMKDSNQSSPFQVVFENDNTNRKVIILKKVTKDANKSKMKSKLQISASENDVNVSNIEESVEKNEIYRLLPGAKTISVSSTPGSPQKGFKFGGTKKIKEKEKISFQRLPQIRKDLLKPKPPRIQIVKNENRDEDFMSQQGECHGNDDSLHLEGVQMNDCLVEEGDETGVKREEGVPQHHEDNQQKFFTLSDLSDVHMDEHIVENVEHLTEEGQIESKDQIDDVDRNFLVGDKGVETALMVKEDVEGHQIHHRTGQIVQTGGLEELVNIATAADPQQITFTTTADGDIAQTHHFAQIAYTSDGNPGEITLHEDINNMTAVVINDIDEEQLNTLLMSNVVEQKAVEIEGHDQSYVQKKIVYQTIDQDKNVIVLQPDSQAFIEEDGGSTSSGAPRVYIINNEGHIVSTSNGGETALAHEISYIDPDSFVGLKLSSDPDHPAYSIGHLIDNYAIASPTKTYQKSV